MPPTQLRSAVPYSIPSNALTLSAFKFLFKLPRAFPQPRQRSFGKKKKEEAVDDVTDVLSTIKPDNFSPTIITKSNDYVYAEFQSPTFGVSCIVARHFVAAALVQFLWAFVGCPVNGSGGTCLDSFG